ncbi:HNH endonuclease [Gordonia rubripertincta]|uniref:HNH endonuclease n=1 Tax=Gordonia rubripertincta TaxID=36822 RepID=A0AAW4G8M3_GORRU|nr:HNH endonuclease [Gordonia rubripertincta]MBM7279464.1 HNH endonuclease [Gordonia rubripertincta]QMU19282.1 HNH endonuclease [Gordonia rubripertincta]TSD98653.1 HNH endonuclease [Gordonia rubripertincta]
MTHRSHHQTSEVRRLHGGAASPAAGSRPWTRRRVLLLNATYEPLSAVTIRRAVVLILCGRADLVHADESAGAFHSAATEVAVPTVIRLRNYVRVPYRATVPMTRAALMHRDRFRCGYCGKHATTIDHVVPRSRGGAHNWENCVACCASCNHRKADRLLSELGWTLRNRPVAPKGRHWGLIAAVKDIDPAWMQYIDAGAA